ncbi:MAG: hypothetical protein KJO28_10025 [Desulfofustis sp.]|nr:hypothetical protein [Desulfofustis sp.]
MRCPKCGYISFDNVDKCLKCRKNIADVSSQFQGSVLNVATPVFLKLVPDEEEVGEMEIPQEEVEIEEEDLELSDPDLDILLDEEEGGTTEVQLEMEDEGLETSALGQLNDNLSEIESFSEEGTEEEAALELGELDEMEMEQAFSDEEPEETPNLKMPDELSDISDLSPPEKEETVSEAPPEGQPAESEIDLDFGDLAEEFGKEATTAAAAVGAAGVAAESKKEGQTLSLDMDEELDFDLDLGGLSIHDQDKKE